MRVDIVKKRRDTRHRLRKRLEELPRLSSVVTRLVALDRGSESFFDELLSLVEEDPPFAADLLRMANSAVSGPNDPVTTLQGALSRLGSRPVSNIVTAAALARVFVAKTDGQRRLWSHSVQVALGAREIAGRLPRVDVAHAYLAGLLHDIGRFFLYRDSTDELGTVEESGYRSAAQLSAAEREMCGFDHTELGDLVCAAWGLPEEIRTVIREHHGPDTGGRDVLAVTQVADRLSHLLMNERGVLGLEENELAVLLKRRVAPGAVISPGALVPLVPRVALASKEVILQLGLEERGPATPPAS